ncbi:MAG: hybrid sensor histidine kinase/response regulator [Polyangiaceae bacterium]|nr:hybrid sensor histidine kinase/response regulator [Polyangiaceae bacterium]
MPSRWNAPLPTASASLTDPQRDLRGALHEVANALTVVVGWLERTADTCALPADARRAVEIALARALDGRLVARRAIGADVGTASVEEDLSALVVEAATGAVPQADAKNVRIEVDAVGGALVDDARQALQIITNLLFNAVAFSPPGASVALRATTDGEDVVVTVTDSGPGVPEAARRGLFSSGASTRPGGAGVGLAHSRALARMHGGDLSLLPGEGGARFELRWPRAATRSHRGPATGAHEGLAGTRVLVVEDDPAVLVLLETALGSRGVEVRCARDAQELARATVDDVFDAALLDLSPLADGGLSLIAALRARNPAVRVVLISGQAAPPDEVVRACERWVRKPFDLAEITSVLAPPRESS